MSTACSALSLLALDGAWTSLFFVGTAVAGAGFGSAFLGAFRSLATLVGPTQRAGLFAAMYVVSYLANSMPAILAGMAVPSLGLRTVATWYGLVVIVLAALAMLGGIWPRPALPAAPALPGGPVGRIRVAAGSRFED
jgi:hypothetical protein